VVIASGSHDADASKPQFEPMGNWKTLTIRNTIPIGGEQLEYYERKVHREATAQAYYTPNEFGCWCNRQLGIKMRLLSENSLSRCWCPIPNNSQSSLMSKVHRQAGNTPEWLDIEREFPIVRCLTQVAKLGNNKDYIRVWSKQSQIHMMTLNWR
jgi:hypothetical protein